MVAHRSEESAALLPRVQAQSGEAQSGARRRVQAVAEALEIHPFMLSRWRKEARDGRLHSADASGAEGTAGNTTWWSFRNNTCATWSTWEDPALLAELFQAVIAVIRRKGFGVEFQSHHKRRVLSKQSTPPHSSLRAGRPRPGRLRYEGAGWLWTAATCPWKCKGPSRGALAG